MPKTRPANPGQLRVRIKWYVSRQSNFSALSLTNSNCPYRTRMWRGLLLITDQIEEACDNAPFSARFHTTRCACGEARYYRRQRRALPQIAKLGPVRTPAVRSVAFARSLN